MARQFLLANTEYLETDSTPLTAAPFAMGCWYFTTVTALNQTPMFVGNKDESDQYFEIQVRGTTNIIRALARNGAERYAITSSSYSVSTWHYLIAIFATPTDRRVLLDGGSKGTNATSCTPAGANRISIGRCGDSSPQKYTTGNIAEPAIWDLSVWPGATDVDKADNFEAIALPALAQGYSPLFFPLGLVAYWPLIRDEDQDRVGGYDLTAFNTPSVAAHLPVIYPALQIFYPAASGAPPAGLSIPVAMHHYMHKVFG